ncbi:MAG TPA: EAL domain-containing protein [Dehalococcoidia bacterium]|nr:EAL domain-containing protein [Dehalococcoidia bacterium]
MTLGIAIVVTIIAIIVIGVSWLTRDYRDAAGEAQLHSETSQHLNNFSITGAGSIVYLQFYLRTGHEEVLTQARQLQTEAIAELDQAARLQHGHLDHSLLLQEVRSEASTFIEQTAVAVTAYQNGDTVGAQAGLANMMSTLESVGTKTAVLREKEQALIKDLTDHSNRVANLALYMLIAAGALGLGTTIVGSWTLFRSIMHPLSGLQAAAAALAAGDLTARAPTTGPVEIATLGEAFNDMTDALLDASKRHELEAQREVLVHDLGERVKELTALQRVSRLLQEENDVDEVVAGVAAIIPPALQYPEAAGALVRVDSHNEATINFAETQWTHRVAASTESGASVTVVACYHEEFPAVSDAGPFLQEEAQLLTAIAEMLVSYLDRQDATQRADQSIERFSKAFHGSPAPIVIVRSRDGRLIDANAEFCDVLGWEREEALSRTVDELNMWADEGERERFRAQFAENDGSVTHGEYALRTRDGQRRYAYGSAETIQLDGEKCTLSIFYDVTARKEAETALHDAEQRWSSLVKHTSDIVSIVDTSGKLFFESPSAYETFGFAPGELLGQSGFDFIHHEDVAPTIATFQELVADPSQAKTVEFRFQHKDGSYRRLQAVGSALLDAEHKLTGVVILSRDVTEQRQMEEHVAFQARLLEASSDAVVATDPDGMITYWNAAAEAMFGWTKDDVGGKPVAEVIRNAELTDGDLDGVKNAVANGPITFEWNVRMKDDSVLPIETTMSQFTDDAGAMAGLIGVTRDVTERKRAEETIRHMAYHDPLTGLPNRLLLTDRFEIAIANAKRAGNKLCVLSLDLDRFKVVNDTMGHATGDQLLKAAADRLREQAREGDTVARVGGDEFILLLACGQAGEGGLQSAQRLVEAFRLPFVIAQAEYRSTLSVGIAVYPDDGERPEALLAAADAAMYAAKESGRDGWRTFGPETNTRPAGWLALEAQLRHALTRDEIAVFYQPQVSVETGRIVGVEALARWRHPQQGLMQPSEFIQLAEDSGLIVALGDEVLTQACSQGMAWTDDGAEPLTVAVNVSLRQIERPDFIDTVERALATTGFPPQCLELEITESTALTSIALTRSVAEKLASMGIRIALDDFGTGNTALRYLSELPVDTLKIDQSFIQNMVHDDRNAEIAASVIALGQALSLNIVAEGVETEEQLQFLRDHNCQTYQGFLHSKPMPAAEMRALLKSVPPAQLTVARNGNRK